MQDKYVTDAYHSLSIEGYRVTRELIELVRTGNWQAEASVKSKKHLDAMAAKGYWDAFQEVKKSVRAVLQGDNSGQSLEQAHNNWYLALFGQVSLPVLLNRVIWPATGQVQFTFVNQCIPHPIEKQ